MAIASMQKMVIVAHRSQVAELLEVLQGAGVVQILNAERAMVSKEWPELMVEMRRHRDLEESIDRLDKAITFLKPYAEKGQTSLFAPLVEIDRSTYENVVSQTDCPAILDRVESLRDEMEALTAEAETLDLTLEKLLPWQNLTIPVEELGGLASSTTFAGLIAEQDFEEAEQKLTDLGAAIEVVEGGDRVKACIVACLNESATDVNKALRSVDFEPAAMEGLSGIIADIISDTRARQSEMPDKQAKLEARAAEAANETLTLQILFDYHQNLHGRVVTEGTLPATDHAVFLEGWVKTGNYHKVEKLVATFDASDIAKIEPAEDEEIPIEIDNGPAAKPFETITRLYGIPSIKDVDPTVFLAPFFALFFGLCLTDAGYGIVLTILLAWAMKKMQGDKGALLMLLICSVLTIAAGAITGGWFADTVQTLLPQEEGSFGASLEALRQKMMLFDPMAQPLIFIGISLALGFIQVMSGLIIGFFNHLRQKDYAAAIYEKLTWVILLSCILLFALAGNGVLPSWLGKPCGIVALIMVGLIFWCTERNSGMAGRIGGGVFAVFSTVFYMGDMLSYVRIMALGMVTAGLGMAVNILTKLVMDVPYVGFILGLLLFIFGHTVNIALSLLSAFVHSLRLQFVEFFPKFFEGGGREFKPLKNDYEHVTIVQK